MSPIVLISVKLSISPTFGISLKETENTYCRVSQFVAVSIIEKVLCKCRDKWLCIESQGTKIKNCSKPSFCLGLKMTRRNKVDSMLVIFQNSSLILRVMKQDYKISKACTRL